MYTSFVLLEKNTVYIYIKALFKNNIVSFGYDRIL